MRVLIVSGSTLFSQGVEALLRQEEGLEIMGREADVDLALERIKAAEVEVVIVDNSDLPGTPGPEAEQLLTTCLLARGQCAKVIGLSLRDNTICILHSERRQVQQMADLVAAIEGPGTGARP